MGSTAATRDHRRRFAARVAHRFGSQPSERALRGVAISIGAILLFFLPGAGEHRALLAIALLVLGVPSAFALSALASIGTSASRDRFLVVVDLGLVLTVMAVSPTLWIGGTICLAAILSVHATRLALPPFSIVFALTIAGVAATGLRSDAGGQSIAIAAFAFAGVVAAGQAAMIRRDRNVQVAKTRSMMAGAGVLEWRRDLRDGAVELAGPAHAVLGGEHAVELVTRSLENDRNRSRLVSWRGPGDTRHWFDIVRLQRDVAEEAGVLVDVSDLVQARSRVEHLLVHDSETGLLNLDEFARRVADESHRDLVRIAAVRFSGLSELRRHFGAHLSSPALAAQLQRVTDTAGDEARIARGGPDSLVIAWTLDVDVDATVAAMTAALDEEIQVDSVALQLPCTIGVADAGRGCDADELVRAALSRANLDHDLAAGPTHAFAVESANEVAELKRLSGRLTEELEVRYQPIIDVATGQIRILEGLVRQVGAPERGPWFLAGLHALGREVAMDTAVISSAIRDLSEGAVPEPIGIALNVTHRTIQEPRFACWLDQLLEGAGVDRGRVAIEVSEMSDGFNSQRMTDALAEVRATGVQVALDDYGKGTSSLWQLRTLPVDCVKIDRSFIQNIDVDERDASIVKSTIELAHRLDLTVVAEGVETTAVAELLSAWNCDLNQGFLYGRAETLSTLFAGARPCDRNAPSALPSQPGPRSETPPITRNQQTVGWAGRSTA